MGEGGVVLVLLHRRAAGVDLPDDVADDVRRRQGQLDAQLDVRICGGLDLHVLDAHGVGEPRNPVHRLEIHRLENEADAIAVRILPRAGIDPAGLVTFFKELIEDRERTPSTLEQWFSTHPLTEERIANVRALIQALPPEATRNLAVTSQSYQTFKQRVRSLPAPPREFRTSGDTPQIRQLYLTHHVAGRYLIDYLDPIMNKYVILFGLIIAALLVAYVITELIDRRFAGFLRKTLTRLLVPRRSGAGHLSDTSS